MDIGISDDLRLDDGGLLRLMSWLSPAFPVGGFSYSHGIEYAVEAGLLIDRHGVVAWISTILGHGAGWIDAGLFLEAHRAATAFLTVTGGDEARLVDVVALAGAMRGTAETALEAKAQGKAFLSAIRAAWPMPRLEAMVPALGPSPSYAVAVAVVTAAAAIGETPALTAYLSGFAATLVSAAVRLVPLGQTDGQRVQADLAAAIPGIVERARLTPLADLGGAVPMVDWTSMQHETQYTRLFRS
jgi:urease accessory protein